MKERGRAWKSVEERGRSSSIHSRTHPLTHSPVQTQNVSRHHLHASEHCPHPHPHPRHSNRHSNWPDARRPSLSPVCVEPGHRHPSDGGGGGGSSSSVLITHTGIQLLLPLLRSGSCIYVYTCTCTIYMHVSYKSISQQYLLNLTVAFLCFSFFLCCPIHFTWKSVWLTRSVTVWLTDWLTVLKRLQMDELFLATLAPARARARVCVCACVRVCVCVHACMCVHEHHSPIIHLPLT